MTPELTALGFAFLLQVAQYFAYAIRANLDVGPGYAMSPRDREPSRPISILGGRLQRALNNHFENLILFTIAVVLVTLSDTGNGFTATCAWIYVVARVLFVLAYAFGLSPWRSLCFATGFFATLSMVISALIQDL